MFQVEKALSGNRQGFLYAGIKIAPFSQIAFSLQY